MKRTEQSRNLLKTIAQKQSSNSISFNNVRNDFEKPAFYRRNSLPSFVANDDYHLTNNMPANENARSSFTKINKKSTKKSITPMRGSHRMIGKPTGYRNRRNSCPGLM